MALPITCTTKQIQRNLYLANCAESARPLSNLLKKNVDWCWHADMRLILKQSRTESLLRDLALPDSDRPFSVVYITSKFAIGSALLQIDAEGQVCESS